MMSLLLFAILLGSSLAQQAPVDNNCTDAQLKYDATAVNCEDKLSGTECENIFGKTKAEVGKDAKDREAKCFLTADKKQTSDQVKRFAILVCPKTCGFCCQTPEYNCENNHDARIDCSRVTTDMCKDSLWKPILSKDCPKTCGLCLEGVVRMATFV
ncbi:unnamed protein product [Strongylus vulgaris]|uniref:ShKT domain-containing protein n=1 Tax=Strongylus vulgaris TaxID=40348 RepID=A0A3P7J6L1_STRVU|nr:unnamed protein product [Strongylus vulgaris]